MKQASLKSVQPVLPSQDAAKSISYYVDKLGFSIAFQDNEANPTYAGVVRDQVEIHFQWHDPKEWEAVERPMLRVVVENIDKLYQEYSTQDVFHANTKLQKTPWGTYEFAFYDLYMNGLAFYQEL